MSIIMNKNTQVVPYQGNDKLLLGIVLGVITFWLFAQTTLNIAPTMQAELGITENWSNIAVSITALFSGIFIVVMGGLGDRIGFESGDIIKSAIVITLVTFFNSCST